MRTTNAFITALALTLATVPALGTSGTYVYDARGHVTSEDYGNGTTITYTYDADSNRATRTRTYVAVRAPLVEMLEVRDVTTTSASLHGIAVPNGAVAVVHFEYGTDPDALDQTSAPQTLERLDWGARVATGISELEPGTDYHVRAVATTALGVTVSDEVLSFTTPTTDEVYTVDNVVPTVAITLDDSNPTHANSVVFSVDFSEAVSNVNAADFSLALSGVTATATVTVGDAGDWVDDGLTRIRWILIHAPVRFGRIPRLVRVEVVHPQEQVVALTEVVHLMI